MDEPVIKRNVSMPDANFVLVDVGNVALVICPQCFVVSLWRSEPKLRCGNCQWEGEVYKPT